MFKPTPLTRELFACTLKVLALRVFAVSAILVLGILVFSVAWPVNTFAVTSNTINFQARLENADGSIAPDGNYNVEFKLYKALTPIGAPDQGACTDNGGTTDPDCVWVETRSGANAVKVANGYLTVNLGSVTPFSASIDWSQQLYLTMNIGGTGGTPTWDGEMNPRLQLTAVPYAFDTQQLGGVDASKYARQDASNTFTGATNTFDLPTSGVAVLQNATTTAGLLSLDPEATSSLALQVKSGGSTELSIDGNGNVVSQGSGTFATANGTTGINTGTGSGTQRIDSSGNLLNIGNISGSGTLQLSGPTGSSYIMSALGVGTTSPQAGSALTIANSSWISGVAAGGGYINMFQVNSNNEIQVGAALNVDGGITLPSDSGSVTLVDEPFATSGITAGTANSYTLGIGQSNALTVYGENDGSGNAQNVRVSIGSSITPQYTLDVNGTSGTLFGVDTTNNQVLFGNSATNAKLVLNSSGGSAINILAPSSAAGYTVTLPAAAPATSQCLQTSGSDATLLAWSSCGSGGGVSTLNTFSGAITLQGTADEITVNNNAGTITLSTPQAINTTSNVTFASGTFDNVTVANSGYILLNGSGTRPTSPAEGTLYYDTTTKKLLVYSNGKWQADRTTANVIVAASNSSQADKDAADYVASSTSAQTQINAALGQLPSGGGTVYLMEGTYTISGSIILPSNVTLTGSGAASIIQLNSATASVIKAIVNADATNGNNHTTISNLHLDGNYGVGNRFSDYGIYLTKVGPTAGSSVGAQITGLSVENFGSNGVYLTGSSDSVIRGNTFLNNGVDSSTASIYFDSSSTDGVIANNWVDASGGDGVRLQNGASSNTVTGNTIVNAFEYGIKVATANNTITGNTLTDTTGHQIGIYIGGDENSVTANNISGGSEGILALGSEDAITGNTVSGTSSHGIDVESPSNTVSSNKVYNAGGSGADSGIYLASASGNNITGNSITDTVGTGYAINISDAASSNNYLSNNTYSGTGAATINDAGAGTIFATQTDGSGNLINKSQGGGFAIGASSATASLTLQGGLVSSMLPAPATPTLATTGTAGTTTYGYKVTALDGLGETLPSAEATIATGNATLNGTNYVTVSWTPVGGAVQYKVYRTTSGGTPSGTGLIGTVSGSTTSFDDTGIAATTAAPSSNTTGGASFAGLLQGQLGATISGATVNINNSSNFVTNINTGTSTGAVNIGNAAAGAITLQSAGTFTASASNFVLASNGAVQLNGGATIDLTTKSGLVANRLTIKPGTSSGPSSNGALAYIQGGDASGTTSVTGGGLTLLGGNATGASGTRNGGSVTIDAGTGATTNGSISIGTANAVSIAVGRSGTTTTFNGSVTVAAGQSIALVGGITSTRPASPTAGMLYYDSTTNQLLQYNGSKWVSDHSTATKIVAASTSTQAEKDAADYVATGTSDQTTINSAISALPSSGGTVYLEEGTYTIDGSINMPSNATLTGAGPATVIKFKNSMSSTETRAITNQDQVNGNSHITISNLKLDGNKANQTNLVQEGFFTSGTTNSDYKLSGLYIENFSYYAASLPANSTMSDTVIDNNNSVFGTTFITGANAILRGITYYGNAQGINPGNYTSISNSNIYSNAADGIKVSSYDSIVNNVINGNTSNGITLAGSNSTIIGNTISNNTSNGVSITGNNNIISNNTIYNNGASGGASGVLMSGSAANNSVTGNMITDTAGTGFAIADNGGPNSYSNNTYSGTGASSISYPFNLQVYNANGQLDASGNQTYMSVNGTNIFREAYGKTADLLQGQDASGNTVFKLDATGGLTLGRIAAAGTTPAGSLTLGDGTTDNFGATLNTTTLTTNQTISLPNASGTLCLDSGNCNGGGTNGGYIVNGTAQQVANFNIKSASAGSIGALVQGADNATQPVMAIRGGNTPGAGGDLLDLQTWNGSTATTVASFDNKGNLGIQGAANTSNAALYVKANSSAATHPAVAIRSLGGGAGDLLDLQNSSGNITSKFNTNGDLQIGGSNSATSTTALNVQNTSGASILTVDTANSKVIIGSASSPGVLSFVGGATASRPASPTAGMLYYDSTTNQLLQYNGSKWVSAPRTATVIVAPSTAGGGTQAEQDAADVVATGTDDGASINTAISKLPAAGGLVYLEEGTYILGATSISLPNNTTLAGAGTATTLTYPNSMANATYKAIVNTDTSTGTQVAVRDLLIDGNKAGQTTGTFYGIYFTGMGGDSGSTARAGGKIANVVAKNLNGAGRGIYLSASSYNILTANTAMAGNGDGIGLYNSSYNTLTGNTVQGNASDGFMMMNGGYNTFTGNTVEDNVYGLYVSSDNNTFTSNILSGNTSYGFDVLSSNNTITGNRVNNSGGANGNNGIYVPGGSYNTITNNIVTDSSCSITCYAISVPFSWAIGNYLSNNTYSGDGTHSVTINDAGTGTIYANQQDGSGNLINKSQGGGFAIGATSATASLTLQGGLQAIALPVPAAPSVTVNTTGAVSYTYQITALDGVGETTASISTTIANGAATPNNTVTWTAISGAVNYNIYRCTGTSCTPLKLVTVSGNTTSYNDTATGSPSGIAPLANTTGGVSLQGGMSVGLSSTTSGQLTFANASNSNTVTLVSGVTSASYSLTLPTAAPATSQCLQSGASTASQLTWGSCGSGGGGVTSINTTATGAVTIQGTTNQIIVNTSGSVITLSGPQDLAASSSVTFGGLTLNGFATLQATSAPTGTTGYGKLYVNSGGTQLHFVDQSGNDYVVGGAQTITLAPEFAGAVFSNNGKPVSANGHIGTMQTDHDSTNGHNYYDWSTDQTTAQDYDIIVQYQLPSDFTSFTAGSWKLSTYADDITNGDIQYMILDSGNNICYTAMQSAKPASNATWDPVTLADPANGCTFAANDIITIDIRPVSTYVSSTTDHIRIGELQFGYN